MVRLASDPTIAQTALLVSAILIAVGGYGMTASRSLLRQLISAEVIFNGILILLLVIMASTPVEASALALILVAVVSGEIIVAVAVVAGLYRKVRSFSSAKLEEEGV